MAVKLTEQQACVLRLTRDVNDAARDGYLCPSAEIIEISEGLIELGLSEKGPRGRYITDAGRQALQEQG